MKEDIQTQQKNWNLKKDVTMLDKYFAFERNADQFVSDIYKQVEY